MMEQTESSQPFWYGKDETHLVQPPAAVGKAQLTIPYATAKSLDDEKKCKLMVHQCRNIQIQDWEISELLKLCRKKDKILKGLALLYKYAGFVDDLRECLTEVFYILMSRLEHRMAGVIIPPKRPFHHELFVAMLKLFYIICNWRKLQWTPRPIYFQDETGFVSFSVFIVQLFKYVVMSIKNYHPLAFFSDDSNDVKVMLANVMKYYNKTYGEFETVDMVSIVQIMDDVIVLESLITEKWQELHDNVNAPGYNIALTATLCLPYGCLKNYASNNKWFISLFDKYDQYIQRLGDVLLHVLNYYKTIGKLDLVYESCYCLRESSHFQGFFSKKISRRESILAGQYEEVQIGSISPLSFVSQLVSIVDVMLAEENRFSGSSDQLSASPRESVDRLDSLPPVYQGQESPPANAGMSPEQYRRKHSSFTQIDTVQLDKSPSHPVTAPKSLETQTSPNAGLQLMNPKNYIVETPNTTTGHHYSNQVPFEKQSLSTEGFRENSARKDPYSYEMLGSDYGQDEIMYYRSDSEHMSPSSAHRSKLNSISENITPLALTHPSRVARPRFYSDNYAYQKHNNTSPGKSSRFSDPHGTLSNRLGVNRNRGYSTPNDYRSNSSSGARWSTRKRLRGVDFSIASLSSALQQIDSCGYDYYETAARKIAIWYMIVGPRKRLLSRLDTRDFISGIIDDIVDQANNLAIVRRKRRQLLMRQGAALKIQKLFRRWLQTVVEEEKRIAKLERSKKAWTYLIEWRKCVNNAIRIHHYIRYAIKKRLMRKDRSKGRLAPLLSSILEKYCSIVMVYKKLNLQMSIQNRMGEKNLAQGGMRRKHVYKSMEKAVVKIQSATRGHLAREDMKKRKHYDLCRTRVILFLVRCLGKRTARRKQRHHISAVKIQKVIRGFLARMRTFDLVESGLKINAMWRKYLAYRNLKSQLRRVDRPLTIVIHGLRNVPKKVINHGDLHIKVSVWWNPLLHLIGDNDSAAVVASKAPQLIYTTAPYRVRTEDDQPVLDLDMQSRAAQTIGKFFTNANRNFASMVGRVKRGTTFATSTLPSTEPTNTASANAGGKRISNFVSKLNNKQATALPAVQEASDSDMSQSSSPQPALNPIAASLLKQRLRYKMQQKKEQSSKQLLEAALGESEQIEKESSETEADPLALILPNKLPAVVSPDQQKDRPSVSEPKKSVGFDRHQSIAAAKKIKNKPAQPTIAEDVEPNSKAKIKTAAVVKTMSFAFQLNSAAKKHAAKRKTNVVCNFHDETIKIPGCHGNGCIKFEVFEGDRKLGSTYFYLRKEGGLMYWGGEYQKDIPLAHQRRAVQFNNKILAKLTESATTAPPGGHPIIDFRVVAGAPLRSKCQWAKVTVRGNGPIKRQLNGVDVVSNQFNFFDRWDRFFASIDEFGLYFFENKYDSKAVFYVGVKDFKSIHADIGAPIRIANSSGKSVGDDIHNVCLLTHSGDEVIMRFPDANSRVNWVEVLSNVISYQELKSVDPMDATSSWISASKLGHKDSDQQLDQEIAKKMSAWQKYSQRAFSKRSISASEESESKRSMASPGAVLNLRARTPAIFSVPMKSLS